MYDNAIPITVILLGIAFITLGVALHLFGLPSYLLTVLGGVLAGLGISRIR